MVVGIGIDVVEISRIRKSLERFGTAFISRLLHQRELDDLPEDVLSSSAISHVAARFAAKEAAVKALGTGFAEGIGLHDVRICSLPSGQPLLSFHGPALKRLELLHAGRSFLSLTHEREYAAAVVVLESEK